MFFFSVAFNLGAAACVAGPSKPRYGHIICHNLAGVGGLSHFDVCVSPSCSPVLGVSALKKEAAAAAAAPPAKKKDAGSESRSEKKRKSALEEIIEVGMTDYMSVPPRPP